MGNYFGTIADDVFLGEEGGSLILGNEGVDTLNGDAQYAILKDGTYDGTYSAITNELGSGLTYSAYVWGDDFIDGGAGKDYLYGDARNVGIQSTSGQPDGTLVLGNDTLFGGDGDDEVAGDGVLGVSRSYSPAPVSSNVTNITLVAGADVLNGGSGNDRLYGDGVNSSISYGHHITEEDAGSATLVFGDDLIDGGEGNDAVFGDSFNIFFNYGAEGAAMNFIGGNDTLIGGDGNDFLTGEAQTAAGGAASWQIGVPEQVLRAGDDVLMGGAGGDTLFGDVMSINIRDGVTTVISGNDTLIGGVGNDRLYGDCTNIVEPLDTYVTGADTFVFESNSGNDTIYDFEVGQDLIDVSALGYSDYSEVAGLITVDATTGNVIIDWDGTSSIVDQVTLLGVNSLSASDFVFA